MQDKNAKFGGQSRIRLPNKSGYVLLRYALVLAAGLLFSEGIIAIIQFRAESDAKGLLSDVRSLRTGKSTEIEVLKIVKNYKGIRDQSSNDVCSHRDVSYDVSIANAFLNSLGLRYSFFRFAIWTPREVLAVFMVKNGKLCYASYSVNSLAGNSWKRLSIEANLVPASSDTSEVKAQTISHFVFRR